MSKLIPRPKSHAEWTLLFVYAVPVVGLIVALVVLVLRWMTTH